MVCTGNNTVASPAFCNINAESGCVYNHAIRQLFYYPVENKTNTENTCNYDNHYSYGNGYTSTVTEKLTPIYCCDSTRKDLLLKYTDPDGEWVHFVVGAVMGAINGAIMASRSGAKGWQWVGYIGVGAVAGALSAGVANGASVALAGAGGTFGMGFVGNAYSIAQFGFMQGAIIGGAAGFTAGFIGGAGYSWMGGANFGQGLENGLKAGGWGALSGAVVGGLYTGIKAVANGKRFWDGATVTKEVIADHNMPIIYDKSNKRCIPNSVASTDQSFGGNLDPETVYRANLQEDGMIYDGKTWKWYGNNYGHDIECEENPFNLDNIVRRMGEWDDRVGINLESGSVNRPGHKVMLNKITLKTVTPINRESFSRYIFQVMDPASIRGYRNIDPYFIKNAANIFYICP